MTEIEKYSEQIKQALAAIKNLKSQLQAEKNKQHEPIAIIGMAMRFPGNVCSADDLWNLLVNNIDAIEDIPNSRYDNSKIYDEHGAIGKSVLKQGGYLKNIDLFDANFFDLSRIETESLDPQQRILLELTHEALENAGIVVDDLINTETGVFVGITSIDYQKKHFRSGDYNLVNPYSYTGSAVCANAGRISYTFGLQGPSISIDTACSSSLVATHLAVQSLRKNESNVAIVGAANLILEPELSICFTALSGLSKDARCRPFSNNANGFVRSEGAAILVLKRLSDAENDKDNILAIIKGSAVNQDGKSNGFTAPSVLAQTKLIQTAIQDAQINPNDVDYIEAHGTGTKIGDPIELEALSTVFEKYKSTQNPLQIASVKSNIGHTESVAGLAGLIKNIVSIQHKLLPKNLHSEVLNQLVDWQNLPIKVVQENINWNTENKFVGVSSFGVTGTNAHVILGHFNSTPTQKIELRNDVYVLPLSAKTEQALADLIEKYILFIENSTHNLEDICAMAAIRRTHFKYRKTFVSTTKNELIQALNDFLEIKNIENITRFDDAENVKITFVFPGQGAQWVGMARNLIKQEEVFKKSLEEFNTILKDYANWDLFEILNQDEEAKLNELDIVQPTLVAIGIALANLWKSKGVFPNAVIGHSLGEVAAAYIAQIIKLEDAVKIICKRSQLMKNVSGQGLMLATDLSFEEANDYIKDISEKIAIAVVNSKNSLVLSGDNDAIINLSNILEQENRFARLIKVDVASHSHHMHGIDTELEQVLGNITAKNSNIDFYSTVQKQKVDGTTLDASYWKKNLRQTVYFKEATEQLLQYNQIFIEMSPHPTLLHAIQQNIEDTKSKSIVLGSFSKDKNDFLHFYENLGLLFEHNFKINFKNIYNEINNFVQLPNYAWQKERYWFEETPNISTISSQAKNNGYQDYYSNTWHEISIEKQQLQNKNILIWSNDENKIEIFRNILVKNNNVFTQIDEQNKIDTVLICNFIHQNENTNEEIVSLQQIIKELSNQKSKLNIVLLSENAFVVNQDKILNTNASIFSGIFRTLRNEEPEYNFKQIDIENATENAIIEQALNCISDDICSEIVIRDNQIFTLKISNFSNTIKCHDFNFDETQTILIIGGTSGLGLQLAKFLSEKGAKHIALVSRTGMKAETNAVIEQMNLNQTKVLVLQADYALAHVVHDSIEVLENSMPKVKTIIHAAAVLEDGLFQDTNLEKIDKILKSKINIAKNIYEKYKNNKDTKIIFFSSAASVLGTMAQAVYSGANLFLDNFAQYINQNNGQAISVNWGNIAEIGLAAQDEKRGKNLEEQGLGLIHKNELCQIFEDIFSLQTAQIIPLKIDFNKWKLAYPKTQQNSFYDNFIQQQKETFVETNNTLNFSSLDAALVFIKQNIKNHIATITKIPTSKLKEDETFKSVGIDSLMALQLKNKIQTDFNLNLNVSTVWSFPTIEKYANFIATELNLESQFQQTQPKVENTIEAEVENLSLDELMKQLNDKL